MKTERIKILSEVDISYTMDAERRIAVDMAIVKILNAESGGMFAKAIPVTAELYIPEIKYKERLNERDSVWKVKYEELLAKQPKMLNNKPVIRDAQERTIYIFGAIHDDSILDDLKAIIDMKLVESITVDGEVYLIEDIKGVLQKNGQAENRTE